VYYVRRAPDAPRRPRPPTLPTLAPVSSAAPAPDRRPARPDDRAPPPLRSLAAPPSDAIALHGQPAAVNVTAELSARLAIPGLRTLTIDLDGAELLDDDLAPVLRRAGAAARTAGIALVVRASRTGARRWLARHGLDEDLA